MALGKRQHLLHHIPFAQGQWQLERAFIEKAKALAADALGLNPGLIKHKQGRGFGVVLQGGVGRAKGLLVNPNHRIGEIHQRFLLLLPLLRAGTDRTGWLTANNCDSSAS